MKNFVKLIKQAHEERYSVVMNRIVTKKLSVAFLSTAPLAQAVGIANNLRAQGLNVTNLVIADNATPPPVNLDFKVVNVRDAAQIFPQPEYIFTTSSLDVRVALKNFPASKVYDLNRRNTEHIYETFMAHLDDLQEVYESLIDEESRRTFRGYWLGNITNRLGDIVYSNAAHYFLSGFTPKPGDIFIDGGCYNGWTAAQFVGLGCKVYSFEMNKTNYDIALKLAEEKNFVLENLGLGSYKHESHYIDNKGASRLDSRGKDITTITTLDDYVREKNLPRVDFIKLDVEGAELDVLKGATISISCWKPTLALSAYHKWDDFWTLMNFVKTLRPDYEFAMRQYAPDYASAPHAFNEEDKAFFETFGLDICKLYFNECVLFAR